jgi:hypothetical protein
MIYRPDIDGLRALAITAVLINHAFPALLPGGFIGVDIFFVISGFLITSIIHNSLKNNDFSFIAGKKFIFNGTSPEAVIYANEFFIPKDSLINDKKVDIKNINNKDLIIKVTQLEDNFQTLLDSNKYNNYEIDEEHKFFYRYTKNNYQSNINEFEITSLHLRD